MEKTKKISALVAEERSRNAHRNLPPDPEQENDRRSFRARKAIAAYRKATQCDEDTAVYVLLSDMMHLCDRHPEFGNFEEEYDRAVQCYAEEIMAEGTIYEEAITRERRAKKHAH